MGEVYRAHDLHLDRDVAVKVILPGRFTDPTARERFRREAHVLSRLSHPGVATIFDFDTQDDVDFLVMEYVPGGTLQSRLQGRPAAALPTSSGSEPRSATRWTTPTSAASSTAT